MYTTVQNSPQTLKEENENDQKNKKTQMPMKSPMKHLRVLGVAKLLHRIRYNDPKLHSLCVEPELLLLPNTKEALLHNTNIRSVIINKLSPAMISETVFAKFMQSLYHLPLRSLQAGGYLNLPNVYLRHVLDLVEYSCGVGRGCSWSLEEEEKEKEENEKKEKEEDLNNCKKEENEKEALLLSSSHAANIEVTEIIETNKEEEKEEKEEKEKEKKFMDRKINPELYFVDFSGNTFTVADALRMGKMLFHPRSTLRRVNLSECRLGNLGVQALLQQANGSPRIHNNNNNNNNNIHSNNSAISTGVPIVITNTDTSPVNAIEEREENSNSNNNNSNNSDNDNNETVVPLELLVLRWNGITEDDSLRTFLNILENNNNNNNNNNTNDDSDNKNDQVDHCIMCIDAYGNYLSPALYSRLSNRMVKLSPLLKAREEKRRHKQKEEEKEKEKEKEELEEKEKRIKQQEEVNRNCGSALEFLLTVNDGASSALPSLCRLVSMMTVS